MVFTPGSGLIMASHQCYPISQMQVVYGLHDGPGEEVEVFLDS